MNIKIKKLCNFSGDVSTFLWYEKAHVNTFKLPNGIFYVKCEKNDVFGLNLYNSKIL